MDHFFKYVLDGNAGGYYVDREITKREYEQSYLQYWNRIRKGLGR